MISYISIRTEDKYVYHSCRCKVLLWFSCLKHYSKSIKGIVLTLHIMIDDVKGSSMNVVGYSLELSALSFRLLGVSPKVLKGLS